MILANTEIPHDWRYITTNSITQFRYMYFVGSIRSGEIVRAETNVKYPNHGFGYYVMFFKEI